MNSSKKRIIRVESDIGSIDAEDWERCANPDTQTYNPFISHAFLAALEESGCVRPQTGWGSQHLILDDGNGVVQAVMPLYVKSHSRGEYVFDHSWVDAYEQAGGDYYPKLLTAVPFTPVNGRRLLVAPSKNYEEHEQLLLSGALQLCEQAGASSIHLNFLTEPEWNRLGALGLLQRTDQQFHWHNQGFDTFDQFLESLTSRKRKTIRKERRQVDTHGIRIQWITGRDLTENHWDIFYGFYMDTGSRKWGTPYLNREFFSRIGESMAERILLVFCERDGNTIAGALNLIGGDTLYGRYWGCVEDHKFLHFEACYYQAICYAIEHGLEHVEAGAQGPHKLARGYLPYTTYSAHYFADPRFRAAVADYLDRERDYNEMEMEALEGLSPYRNREDNSALKGS